jgi:CRISPR/Cas system type I-B associated protein Csh2 (Cas7 group RAMP superfamily)
MEELYNSKLSRDKTGISNEDKQKIGRKLLADFEFDDSLDLSGKV